MRNQEAETGIRERFEQLKGALHERSRRLFAASEAMAFGYGGIAAVFRATGIAPVTIGKGLKELREIEAGRGSKLAPGRVRRAGAGRKKTTDRDPGLVPALKKLVEEATRGDPESPLLWTSRSQRNLVAALKKQGHQTSMKMVSRLLKELGYSLRANSKRLEGTQSPDRNEQFEYINAKVQERLANNQPVISVDTKKKELVGAFRNAGKELRRKEDPEPVKVHDFIDEELGKVAPYGVFDLAKNEAWVSVGVNHDTAEFAVQAIRTWWAEMGRGQYPGGNSLLITADGGGSNGYRLRLWKIELQKLVDEIGFPVSVSHFPPGTSKWNKIEHRLFSFITKNWRGKPLISHQVIVNLISATTTKTGLAVRCQVDPRNYAIGRRVSDAKLATVHLSPDPFHGEWNYTIYPSQP